MDAMGVLPGFAGIAVHAAWAPYDTYAAPGHQLCCAHAARELRAVADQAPAGQWCWAAQAAEALTAMQRLAADAIAQRRDAIDPAALAARARAYRSAALIGISQTAARSGKLMKKHNALARRLLDRQDDYLRFTLDFRSNETFTISLLDWLLFWLVDPGLGWHDGRVGPVAEPAGVGVPGGGEGVLPGLVDRGVGAEVDRGRGVPGDAGVPVDVVVLMEEAGAELAGVGE
jgi:hypothetical protein